MSFSALAPNPVDTRRAVLHQLLDESLQLGPE